MAPGFVEYREVSSSEPLRQGDILESVDSTSGLWKRNLFVLTADCDFAHDKNQGRVTCVPLLTADEYLVECHVPQLRNRLVGKPLSELQQMLVRRGSPNVTTARLRTWAQEKSVDEILDALDVSGAERDAAARSLGAIQMIDAPVSAVSDVTRTFVDAQLLSPNPPKRATAVARVTERLQQAFTQTPGDALFLSAIGPAHEVGYFAYLRHLEQIWQPEISIGPNHKQAEYRRISRLQDRFVHALVQRFGMVFMAIGLPTDYEEMRELHAGLLGEVAS